MQLGPDHIQDWDVGSDEVGNLNRLQALKPDILEVDLPLTLVRQFPAQAISDNSPFNPKPDMPEQCDLTVADSTSPSRPM